MDESLWLMRLPLTFHSLSVGFFTPLPKLSKYLMSHMEGIIENREGITFFWSFTTQILAAIVGLYVGKIKGWLC